MTALNSSPAAAAALCQKYASHKSPPSSSHTPSAPGSCTCVESCVPSVFPYPEFAAPCFESSNFESTLTEACSCLTTSTPGLGAPAESSGLTQVHGSPSPSSAPESGSGSGPEHTGAPGSGHTGSGSAPEHTGAPGSGHTGSGSGPEHSGAPGSGASGSGAPGSGHTSGAPATVYITVTLGPSGSVTGFPETSTPTTGAGHSVPAGGQSSPGGHGATSSGESEIPVTTAPGKTGPKPGSPVHYTTLPGGSVAPPFASGSGVSGGFPSYSASGSGVFPSVSASGSGVFPTGVIPSGSGIFPTGVNPSGSGNFPKCVIP